MKTWNNGNMTDKGVDYSSTGMSPVPEGKLMSVSKMGKLLGLKKTERYWLVHKGWFETQTRFGKMWIVRDSFDKWYASQFRYHRTDGVEPGKNLQKDSLSVQEIAQMLGLHTATVYEIIKKDQIRTITVNKWMRVPISEFEKWYATHERYRTSEDRKKDSDAELTSLSMPEMARLLGISRKQVYSILKSVCYRDYFEVIEIAGRKRITWNSFRTFLKAQDKYALKEEPTNPNPGNDHSDLQEQSVDEGADNCPDQDNCQEQEKCTVEEKSMNREEYTKQEGRQTGSVKEYLALSKAAKLAGVSRVTMSKWVSTGVISSRASGRNVFVERYSMEQWLRERSGT